MGANVAKNGSLDARAFVTDDDGGGLRKVELREGAAFRNHGGDGCDVALGQLVEDVVFAKCGSGQAKDRAGGGPKRLLVISAYGSRKVNVAADAEGLGGADEGAEVSGVLKAGGDEHKRAVC